MRYVAFLERYYTDVVKDVGTAYTRYLNRFVSKYFTYGAYRLGLTPNGVTLLSTASVATGVAMLLLVEHRFAAGVLALISLQLAYVFDCCDGQLARLTGRSAAFGAFLDLVLDRFNSVLVFAGFIAAELLRSSEPDARAILFLLAGLLGYGSYSVASMVRGLVFPSTKGLTKSLSGARGMAARAVYELGDMGLHFLLMSAGYLAGIVHFVALAYGVWGLLMTCATVLLVRRIETKNEGV